MNIIVVSISTFIGVILGRFIVDKYNDKKEAKYAQKHTKRIDVKNLTDIHLITNEDSTTWVVKFTANNEEYSFENIKKIVFNADDSTNPIIKIMQ